MSSGAKTALVVGAGLSGLSAAYYLQKAGWQVQVCERSDRVGGRTQTDCVQGYLVDTGASAFADSYLDYISLLDELGLGDCALPSSPVLGIPRAGKIHELNVNRLLLSGLTTGLLSLADKLRLGKLFWDAFSAKWRGMLDYADMSKSAMLDSESVAQYAQRRLGSSLKAFFCDPLVRIMLIADSEEVSKVELYSAMANIIGSRFLGLKGGVNALPQALANAMNVRLSCEVVDLETRPEGIQATLRSVAGESVEKFDACIVSCELDAAAKICRSQLPVLRALQEKLSYTSALTVALGFSRRPATDSLLFALPPEESAEIALMFFDHNKCFDRAPEGQYLINMHWDNKSSKANMHCADEELVERSMAVVLKYFPDLKDAIEMTHVARWEKALPLTAPGNYRAIAAFNRSLNPASRMQFAADYMSSAGQNTAVSFGRRAADNLVRHIGGLSVSRSATP